MNVAYTCRGFELTDRVKSFTEKKLKKLESLDRLIDVNLTMVHARHLFKAELLVHNRNARFNAIEETPDILKSIHAVILKVEKQLKRRKEKFIGRKRKTPPRTVRLAENMAEVEKPTIPRVVRARKQDIRPMSQDEAILQLDSRREQFLIYRDTNSDRINILFKRRDGNYGLIESEI
ncbi:MAG TPA: ribosome-associated translation inhibitor RaiA [Acidobacteriota bacterium]|nr:ribosome-associated translation inhibitor RaiA [Acidobacteriota bacterium]